MREYANPYPKEKVWVSFQNAGLQFTKMKIRTLNTYQNISQFIYQIFHRKPEWCLQSTVYNVQYSNQCFICTLNIVGI